MIGVSASLSSNSGQHICRTQLNNHFPHANQYYRSFHDKEERYVNSDILPNREIKSFQSDYCWLYHITGNASLFTSKPNLLPAADHTSSLRRDTRRVIQTSESWSEGGRVSPGPGPRRCLKVRLSGARAQSWVRSCQVTASTDEMLWSSHEL